MPMGPVCSSLHSAVGVIHPPIVIDIKLSLRCPNNSGYLCEGIRRALKFLNNVMFRQRVGMLLGS